MSEFVDTVGWDVAISVPLSVANHRLNAQRHELIQSLSLTLTADDESWRLAGEIASWRIADGQGVISRIELTLARGTFWISSKDSGGVAHDVSGTVIRLGLEWDAFPSAGVDDMDADLVWCGEDAKPAASDIREDSFSAAVIAPAALSLCHDVKEVLKDVCVAGLRECQTRIGASLARVLSAKFVRPRYVTTLARVAYLVASAADAQALVMLFALSQQESRAAPTGVVSDDEVAALHPVIPAALPMDNRKAFVALSRLLLPTADPVRMISQMLYAAQQPELARLGPISMTGPVSGLRSPSSFSVCSGTHVDVDGFEMAHDGDMNLDIHEDGDIWRVTLGEFACTLHGNELTLNYYCFPSATRLPKRHAVQRFAIEMPGPGESCGQEIALRGRCVTETISDIGGSFFDALLRVCAPWLSASDRIKASVDYLPVELAISLFGEIPLYPEAGYMNGGVVFTASEFKFDRPS